MAAPKNSIRHSKQIKLGYPTLLGNQRLIKIGFFRLWLVFWLFGWLPGLFGSVRVRLGSGRRWRWLSWFGLALALALLVRLWLRSGFGQVRSDRFGWLHGLAWLVWLGCIADLICDLVLVAVLFGLAIPVETHPVALDPFSGG